MNSARNEPMHGDDAARVPAAGRRIDAHDHQQVHAREIPPIDAKLAHELCQHSQEFDVALVEQGVRRSAQREERTVDPSVRQRHRNADVRPDAGQLLHVS